jgi:hypothetical protein
MLRKYRRDALLIFCLLAFVYAYFYQEGGWNANSRFGMIFSIVQEGSLSIDNFQNQPGTETGDKANYNGHYYSDKAIGPSVVGAIVYEPLYWIKRVFNRVSLPSAKIILTFLVIGLPSAIAGSLMFILCYYLSKDRTRAYLASMTIALGTMYLPFSSIFFSHQFASSLIFSAFFMVFFLKENPEVCNNWYLFVIGSLLGWALISEFPTIAIILAIVIYYFSIIWKKPPYRRSRSFLLPMLGGSIPILLQLLYNKLCFGNFFSFGYSFSNNQNFYVAMGQGLMGIHLPDLMVLFYMTFHPLMGLFWESPVLLTSIIGAGYMFRLNRYRSEAILAVWIIGSYLVLMSGYYMWWGGTVFGPRHIIPVLPFFCILLVFIPRRFTWPFVLLSLISIGQMMIVAASYVLVPETMVLKIGSLGFFDYSNIYSFCLQQLIKGDFGWNLGHQLLGLENWSSLIPLLVVLIGATFIFLRFLPDKTTLR